LVQVAQRLGLANGEHALVGRDKDSGKEEGRYRCAPRVLDAQDAKNLLKIASYLLHIVLIFFVIVVIIILLLVVVLVLVSN